MTDLTGKRVGARNRVAELRESITQIVQDYLTTLPSGDGGSSTITPDDTPAAPAEGESASYFVTAAVTWPAGLVWSTDPDGGVAPTVTGTALVSLFTVDGVTRAIMGATFPGVGVPDTTAPAWSATLTTGTPALTSVVVAASSLATDAVGVTAYEYSINNGSTWTAVAPDGLDFTLTGLVASTAYPAPQFRAKDAAGNISPVLTAQPFTTASPAADTTPPVVGTMAVSSITDTGFTLTVTGASDETGLDAAPYAFTTNGGTTWSAYQSSNVYTAAGLGAGTSYSVNWRVRDGFGNVSPGTAQTVTTTGTAWTPAGVDGLYAWYDPSDTATVTTEMGAVTGILDKSPNGFNATAATEAARGTIGTIGGLQALAFTTTQNLTATTPLPYVMTTQMAVFMVAAQGGTSNKYALSAGYFRIGIGGSGASWRLVHRSDAFADYGTASTAAVTRGGVIDSTGVFQRIGDTETPPIAAGTSGGTVNLISIGNDAVSTVGEVIVIVGRDVPLAERNQIHAYLTAKWGTA